MKERYMSEVMLRNMYNELTPNQIKNFKPEYAKGITATFGGQTVTYQQWYNTLVDQAETSVIKRGFTTPSPWEIIIANPQYYPSVTQ